MSTVLQILIAPDSPVAPEIKKYNSFPDSPHTALDMPGFCEMGSFPFLEAFFLLFWGQIKHSLLSFQGARMGPQGHSFESIFTLGLCLLLGIPKLTVWKPAVRQLALSSSPLFPQNSAHTKSSFCSVRSISSPRSISLLSTSYIPIAIRYMKLIDTQRIKLSPSIPQVPWVHSLPFFNLKIYF